MESTAEDIDCKPHTSSLNSQLNSGKKAEAMATLGNRRVRAEKPNPGLAAQGLLLGISKNNKNIKVRIRTLNRNLFSLPLS